MPKTEKALPEEGRKILTEAFPGLTDKISELEASIVKQLSCKEEAASEMVDAMLGVGVTYRLDDGSLYYDRKNRSEKALYEIVPDEVKKLPEAKNLVDNILEYCHSFSKKENPLEQDPSKLRLQEHLMLRLGAIEGNGIGIDYCANGEEPTKAQKKALKESEESIAAIKLFRDAGFPIEAGFDKGGQDNPETKFCMAMSLDYQAHRGMNALDKNQDPELLGKKGEKLYQSDVSMTYLEEAIGAYRELATAGFEPAKKEYSRSLSDLGKYYLKGDESAGVPLNKTSAVACLREAKEYGSKEAMKLLPQALTELGNSLIKGEGVNKNKKEGKKLLKEAQSLDPTVVVMPKKTSFFAKISNMVYDAVVSTLGRFGFNSEKGKKSKNSENIVVTASDSFEGKEEVDSNPIIKTALRDSATEASTGKFVAKEKERRGATIAGTSR